MKTSEINFLGWNKQFFSYGARADVLVKRRWPDGFICPRCGHDMAHFITTRKLYQRAHCHHQASVTAEALFQCTNLPLTKWAWAVYRTPSDKGGISAPRLTKLLDILWPTAHWMLHKLRIAISHRDLLSRLRELLEVDALAGRKRPGRRSRGTEGKTSMLVACEDRAERAGFLVMEAVASVCGGQVSDFASRRLAPEQTVFTDALPALGRLSESQPITPFSPPSRRASVWLPYVQSP